VLPAISRPSPVHIHLSKSKLRTLREPPGIFLAATGSRNAFARLFSECPSQAIRVSPKRSCEGFAPTCSTFRCQLLPR
jgi:hypothetical protein